MSQSKTTAKPAKRPPKTRLKAVSITKPCPVCGKEHKCSVGDDGLIICGRSSGNVPGFRCLGEADGDLQFSLYRRAGDGPPAPGDDGGQTVEPKPVIEWGKRAAIYARKLTPALAGELAKTLGVPVDVLKALNVGWSAKQGCWTFPERGADGVVVGINRRYRTGKKRMMKGAKRGLYYSDNWAEPDGPILGPEGGSDTAALMAMGLACIGRPSNTGGVDLLAEILAEVPADRAIIVVGENDQKPDGSWPGKDGAVATADKLTKLLGRQVPFALVPPGFKDVREWLLAQEADLG